MPPKKRSAEVSHSSVPPLSHFQSAESRDYFCTSIVTKRIVFERPIAFESLHPEVKKLAVHWGWDQVLTSFHRVNRTWVQEFYANFPSNTPEKVKIQSQRPIVVKVRGKDVDISPPRIRSSLSLPATEPNSIKLVLDYIKSVSLTELGGALYHSTFPPPELTASHLSSQFMSELCKLLGFVVRSLLTPTSNTGKITHQQAALIKYLISSPSKPRFPAEYFIYKAIRSAGTSLREHSSLVFPAVITKLCLDAGVHVHDADVMATENEAAPVDKFSLAKSMSQSDVYVESLEQTLLKQEIKRQISNAVATLQASFTAQFEALRNELKESVGTHAPPANPSGGDGASSTPSSGSSSEESSDASAEESEEAV